MVLWFLVIAILGARESATVRRSSGPFIRPTPCRSSRITDGAGSWCLEAWFSLSRAGRRFMRTWAISVAVRFASLGTRSSCRLCSSTTSDKPPVSFMTRPRRRTRFMESCRAAPFRWSASPRSQRSSRPQALISGAYSLTRQAVQLGFCPRVTIVHTSGDAEGDLHSARSTLPSPSACIWLVLTFKESSALAAAYGIAVTGTMGITSVVLLRGRCEDVALAPLEGDAACGALPLLSIFRSSVRTL